jgi:hypothetical protein
MKGTIIGWDGAWTLYRIWIREENNNISSIPVEHRYFSQIMEDKGGIVGKEIEYRDNSIYFLEDIERS